MRCRTATGSMPAALLPVHWLLPHRHWIRISVELGQPSAQTTKILSLIAKSCNVFSCLGGFMLAEEILQNKLLIAIERSEWLLRVNGKNRCTRHQAWCGETVALTDFIAGS